MPAQSSSPTAAVEENTGPAGLEATQLYGLVDAFAVVPDPRSIRGRWHPLKAILPIATMRGELRRGRADRGVAVDR